MASLLAQLDNGMLVSCVHSLECVISEYLISPDITGYIEKGGRGVFYLTGFIFRVLDFSFFYFAFYSPFFQFCGGGCYKGPL